MKIQHTKTYSRNCHPFSRENKGKIFPNCFCKKNIFSNCFFVLFTAEVKSLFGDKKVQTKYLVGKKHFAKTNLGKKEKDYFRKKFGNKIFWEFLPKGVFLA
jgi:hypothetical protein